jgi:ornithine carbamoyltransferase
MVARVGDHAEVTGLAKYSSVPVINALSKDFHPFQTVADFLTIHEAFPGNSDQLVAPNLKVAWVGDSNNVLYDLAIGCVKTGVDISIASPEDYTTPPDMLSFIESQGQGVAKPGQITQHTKPAEAIKDADILVTDTWISMGQEAESKKRLADFEGYQITEEMAKEGGANKSWKFMHCLPRHPQEVDDDVFYGNRSLVFQEAENRLWAAAGTSLNSTETLYRTNNAIAVLEAFVVNKGKIL